MRLLIVSNMFPDRKNPSYGIFVKNFCNQLDTLGISYQLSVMHRASGKLGKAAGYVSFYLKTVWRLLLSHYDIIYVHYASHSAMPVLWASKLKKLRIFVNVHGSDVVPENAKQEKMQKYTKQILNKSERIIVPSRYFQKYVTEKYQLSMEKIMVYPSAGVDSAVFHPIDSEARQNVRREFGFAEGDLIFGMIGRISAGKGWDTYLKSAAGYLEHYQDAYFLIVGNGPETIQANSLQAALDFKNRLIVIDRLVPQETLAKLYNAIDYLVFPTQREGESLGLVALEAMACGTPVIASAFAAPADYVIDGKNGYQFRMGDAEALIGKLREAAICFHSEGYAKLCQNALDTASAFSVDRITGDLQDILIHG